LISDNACEAPGALLNSWSVLCTNRLPASPTTSMVHNTLLLALDYLSTAPHLLYRHPPPVSPHIRVFRGARPRFEGAQALDTLPPLQSALFSPFTIQPSATNAVYIPWASSGLTKLFECYLSPKSPICRRRRRIILPSLSLLACTFFSSNRVRNLCPQSSTATPSRGRLCLRFGRSVLQANGD